MKINDLLKYGEKRAIEYEKEESSALIVLEYVLKLSPSEMYMNMYNEVSLEDEKKFKSLLDEYIIDNKPVQYIVGYSSFYGYDFIVNKDVLIPRYETEELVEQVLYRYDRYFKGKKVNVADVACGSGCIGITLALEEKNMTVTATDLSNEALVVAKENNDKFNAGVTFLQGDMLKPLAGKKFDIIVSNPPYIPTDEEVMPIVKDNEPNMALFGGNDGMKFYRIILSEVKELLNERALIAFEHGFNKKNEMIELAKKYFPDSKVEVLKDLEGKDRMTFILVGDFNE